MKRLSLMVPALVGLACGGAPQTRTEAAVVYRAGFSAEEGVTTRVTFPLPDDAAQLAVESGYSVTDGGTVTFVMGDQGIGLALEGKGTQSASFVAKAVKGYADGSGPPEAKLTRPVPDAGVNDYFFSVNKGGSAVAQIDFQYTASRDCGVGCGGSKSWSLTGPVGLALQEVTLSYVEEKR